ncbi:hypothetical protein BJ742DRAFT_833472 [Cladochytrium replicatum]|nr:hypothetical protein BJ742DRAFT_833472 [Cladochytrium replicatum]
MKLSITTFAPILASALALSSCFAIPLPGSDDSDIAITVREEPRLYQVVEGGTTKFQWMTLQQVFDEMVGKEVHFMEVDSTGLTARIDEIPKIPDASDLPPRDFPTTMKHEPLVKSLIPRISKDNLKSTVEKLSSYFTRYFSTTTGEEAAQWIFDQANSIVQSPSGVLRNASIRKFTHEDVPLPPGYIFRQFSVIATIPGSSSEKIILGAHEDSINYRTNPLDRAPGADDDATGCAALLEIFRILVDEPNFVPTRTIELHWYAAEEVLKFGSKAIAESYRANNENVVAMLQLDMIGYTPDVPSIAISADRNISPSLNTFLLKVAQTYATVPANYTDCDVCNSDHISWTVNGYHSVFPFEDPVSFNPSIHGPTDTVDLLNFDLVKEFTATALGFAVELVMA